MELWGKIAKRFDEWGAPLRPSPEDVSLFKMEIKPGSRTLLLGVTAELKSLATIAIDNNPQMIKQYPENAILGDWSNLPFENEFDTVIGDGCLTVFQEKPELFFQQIKKALKNNGKLILRTFIAPEEKEDIHEILKNKEGLSFHALKWRLAQSLADPYIPVKNIYKILKPIYNHPTLDLYKGSDLIYYFPKLSELPKWDHIQFATTYELSDRCPLITWLINSSKI